MTTVSKLEKLHAQRAKLDAQIKREKAKENAKARKERTRRLIQVGAIIETAIGVEFDEHTREKLNHLLHTNINHDITLAQWIQNELTTPATPEPPAEEYTQPISYPPTRHYTENTNY